MRLSVGSGFHREVRIWYLYTWFLFCFKKMALEGLPGWKMQTWKYYFKWWCPLQTSRTYNDHQDRGAIPKFVDYGGFALLSALRPTTFNVVGILLNSSCFTVRLAVHWHCVESRVQVFVCTIKAIDLKSVCGRQQNVLVFNACYHYTKQPLDITTQRLATCQFVHCNTAAGS